jgi:hypothetical protein
MQTDKLHPAVDSFVDQARYGNGLTLAYDIEYMTGNGEYAYGDFAGNVHYANTTHDVTKVRVHGFRYQGEGFAISGRIPLRLLSERWDGVEECKDGEYDVEKAIMQRLGAVNLSLLDHEG